MLDPGAACGEDSTMGVGLAPSVVGEGPAIDAEMIPVMLNRGLPVVSICGLACVSPF